MAYTINKNNNTKTSISDRRVNGISSISDGVSFNNSDDVKFYELEPAEVIDVVVDKNHTIVQSTGDDSLIGCIKCRMLYSELGTVSEELSYVKPMNCSMKKIPVIGEYVVIYELMGEKYYMPFDILSSVVSNSQPGASVRDLFYRKDADESNAASYEQNQATGPDSVNEKELEEADTVYYGKFFKPNYDIRPLEINEGHCLIEGRYGNSIRFGSDTSDDGVYNYSPNIIIRAGQLWDDGSQIPSSIYEPVKENINLDGSSIWMTTQQVVGLTPSTVEDELYNSSLINKPEQFDGKQVIINSDRLIFNTKTQQFLCFSKSDIYFNTTTNFVVDAMENVIINNRGTVNMTSESDVLVNSNTITTVNGDEEIIFGDSKGELIVKGETLQSLLEEMIAAIKALQWMSPQGPASLLAPSAIQLDTVKSKLKTMLSERVYTI